MKNKTYDILKAIAQIYLPAIATMILTIFEIWGIPYGTQISATLMAVDTMLGVCLGISSKKYYVEMDEAD